MNLPPSGFAERLAAHAQGLHDIQESGRLSPNEINVISEALGIINLMIDRPDLSNPLMVEIAARELTRRHQATASQANVIWSRVGATLKEAMETAHEIGRVSPEMNSAIKGLGSTLHANMLGLSESSPLIKALDRVELASQQLRKHTRQARIEFHGKPHPSHEQTAILSSLASDWKTPASSSEFLTAVRGVQTAWEGLMGPPKVQSRPSPGRG